MTTSLEFFSLRYDKVDFQNPLSEKMVRYKLFEIVSKSDDYLQITEITNQLN